MTEVCDSIRWRAEIRPCPVCGAESFRRLGRRGGVAHHARRGVETEVGRCDNCHAVYPRPFLLPSDNPYDSDSTEEYFAHHEASRKIKAGRALAQRAQSILGRTGRLLELGCGRGELLIGAREEGWDVAGVEMTPAFAGTYPDLKVELSGLESARSLEESYDVVFLAAILEHVYDPRSCLEKVHRSLTGDGIVFIDVPNECSFATALANFYLRCRRRDWCVNLSPTFSPYHVVGFCDRSLRYLLDLVGFDIIDLRIDRWSSVYDGNGIWGRVEGAAWGAAMRLGAMIGKGDGISCWARRKAGGRMFRPTSTSAE